MFYSILFYSVLFYSDIHFVRPFVWGGGGVWGVGLTIGSFGLDWSVGHFFHIKKGHHHKMRKKQFDVILSSLLWL
jgi:hypothetical protein